MRLEKDVSLDARERTQFASASGRPVAEELEAGIGEL
jgi:hypothetical protein